MRITRTNIRLIMSLLSFITKNPKILFYIVPIFVGSFGLWYIYDYYTKEDMIFMGIPDGKHSVKTLRNDGFVVGYSEDRKNPLWVSYKVKKVPDGSISLKRPTKFEVDNRTSSGVKHDDYTGSGYDRGHMAPNYAISSLYGKDAQLDTFLMSNITPQKPDLNRKLWQRLEEVEIKYFTKLDDEVYVITGPIFDENIQLLKSDIEVPDAFYKVYAMQKGDDVKMLGFIMPQNVKGNEGLDKYVASIDEIERLSGFDFFHKLNDEIENKAEAKIDIDAFNLKSVANLKGRY